MDGIFRAVPGGPCPEPCMSCSGDTTLGSLADSTTKTPSHQESQNDGQHVRQQGKIRATASVLANLVRRRFHCSILKCLLRIVLKQQKGACSSMQWYRTCGVFTLTQEDKLEISYTWSCRSKATA